MDTSIGPSAPAARRPDRSMHLAFALLAGTVLVLFVYWNFGMYTVQPIGDLPDGLTLVVWRAGGEPFFSSPDGRCLQATGQVSLLCRGVALGAAPVKRIVVRLPYQHWAYLASTGGITFEK
jgi:hypothetical protein